MVKMLLKDIEAVVLGREIASYCLECVVYSRMLVQ